MFLSSRAVPQCREDPSEPTLCVQSAPSWLIIVDRIRLCWKFHGDASTQWEIAIFFRPSGVPKRLSRPSWNLARLITSNTQSHMPKFINAILGVYSGQGWNCHLSYFLIFLVIWECLQSTVHRGLMLNVPQNGVLEVIIFLGYHFVSRVNCPHLYPEKLLLGSIASINQRTAFLHISWQPIKLSQRNYPNIKQLRYYIKLYNKRTKGAWPRSRDLILEF